MARLWILTLVFFSSSVYSQNACTTTADCLGDSFCRDSTADNTARKRCDFCPLCPIFDDEVQKTCPPCAGVVIDTFFDGFITIQVVANSSSIPVTASGSSNGTMFTGERDIKIQGTMDEEQNANPTIKSAIKNSASQSAEDNGFPTWWFTWDGYDSDPIVDTTNTAYNWSAVCPYGKRQFGIFYASQDNCHSIAFNVYTDAGVSTVQEVSPSNSDSSCNLDNGTVVHVPFTNFSSPVSADWSSVKALELVMNQVTPKEAVDFSLYMVGVCCCNGGGGEFQNPFDPGFDNPKVVDADCDDGLEATHDMCYNFCQCIHCLCLEDYECDDDDPRTRDFCMPNCECGHEPITCGFEDWLGVDGDQQFVFSWTASQIDGDFSGTIEGPDDGWSAIGFSADGKMDASDVIAGHGSTVTDRYVTTNFNVPTVDGTNNVHDTSVQTSNGRMTVRFTRDLETGDGQDMDILLANQWLIYAYGSMIAGPELGAHVVTYGRGAIQCDLNETCPHASGIADPIMYGFDGGWFQFMGEHNKVFNLISDEHVQINSRFVKDDYWEEMTWLGEIGITIGNDQIHLAMDGGKTLNGNPLDISSKRLSGGKISVSENTLNLAISGYEMFFTLLQNPPHYNIHLDFNKNTTASALPHGVIGQTADMRLRLQDPEDESVMPSYRRMKVLVCKGYNGDGCIEGTYKDYIIKSDDVFGTDFTFNRFVGARVPFYGGSSSDVVHKFGHEYQDHKLESVKKAEQEMLQGRAKVISPVSREL